jgi:hypothetical protein
MAVNKALIQKVYMIGGLMENVRGVYLSAKEIKEKVDLYQAATDAQFNAAVNAIISSGDRARIASLATTLATVITDLETNYSDFINPNP